MNDGSPYCAFEGCDRAAAPRSPLCWTHLWQRRTKGRLTLIRPIGRGSKRTPLEVLLDAARASADVDGFDAVAYRRMVDRLTAAARRYVLRAKRAKRRTLRESPTDSNK